MESIIGYPNTDLQYIKPIHVDNGRPANDYSLSDLSPARPYWLVNQYGCVRKTTTETVPINGIIVLEIPDNYRVASASDDS